MTIDFMDVGASAGDSAAAHDASTPYAMRAGWGHRNRLDGRGPAHRLRVIPNRTMPEVGGCARESSHEPDAVQEQDPVEHRAEPAQKPFRETRPNQLKQNVISSSKSGCDFAFDSARLRKAACVFEVIPQVLSYHAHPQPMTLKVGSDVVEYWPNFEVQWADGSAPWTVSIRGPRPSGRNTAIDHAATMYAIARGLYFVVLTTTHLKELRTWQLLAALQLKHPSGNCDRQLGSDSADSLFVHCVERRALRTLEMALRESPAVRVCAALGIPLPAFCADKLKPHGPDSRYWAQFLSRVAKRLQPGEFAQSTARRPA